MYDSIDFDGLTGHMKAACFWDTASVLPVKYLVFSICPNLTKEADIFKRKNTLTHLDLYQDQSSAAP